MFLNSENDRNEKTIIMFTEMYEYIVENKTIFLRLLTWRGEHVYEITAIPLVIMSFRIFIIGFS